MESNAATLVAPTPHPGWCDRAQCVEDAEGVTHCSTPTVVQVGDEQLTLRLVHTTYRDDPEPRSVEVHCDGESQGFVLPVNQHEWPVAGLPALIAALTDLYFRAAPPSVLEVAA